MALLELEKALLQRGGKTLFSNTSLRIERNERIGLIGPNGAGKTSLLRVLNGELELDAGRLSLAPGVSVGYLKQDLELDLRLSPLQVLLGGVNELTHLNAAEKQLTQQLEQLQSQPDEQQILEISKQLHEIQEKLENLRGSHGEHVAGRILNGLGYSVEQHRTPLDQLSGGWRMRALLGKILFQQPDIVLLDEPTNHLDIGSVLWLRRYLHHYRGTAIIVSHDRDFINQQATRIISFEPQGVRSYTGNYDHYEKQRDEEMRILINRQQNIDEERQRNERFIQRFRAQATKAKAVQSRIKALNKLEDVITIDTRRTMQVNFKAARPSSQHVLQVESLSFAYAFEPIFEQVNLSVQRGQRIAILGANGAGKTTLLKCLAGELHTQNQSLRWGHHVEVGYYAQHHADALNPDDTVLEAVRRIDAERSLTEVRTTLGALLFSDDDVDKKVAVLSGGERARVALAQLLIRGHNALLMDEPTNHLDLQSTEILVDALRHYDGTLLFVSHNLAFIRRLATAIWNVQQRTVETFPGTLDEYINSQLRQLDVTPQAPPFPATKSENLQRDSNKNTKEKRRQRAQWRQQRKKALGDLEDRVVSLEQQIENLENQQRQRAALLEDQSFFASSDSAEVLQEFQKASVEIEALTETWEKAAEELEQRRRQWEKMTLPHPQ